MWSVVLYGSGSRHMRKRQNYYLNVTEKVNVLRVILVEKLREVKKEVLISVDYMTNFLEYQNSTLGVMNKTIMIRF